MVEVGKMLEGKLLSANANRNKPPHLQTDTITSEDTMLQCKITEYKQLRGKALALNLLGLGACLLIRLFQVNRVFFCYNASFPFS